MGMHDEIHAIDCDHSLTQRARGSNLTNTLAKVGSDGDPFMYVS